MTWVRSEGFLDESKTRDGLLDRILTFGCAYLNDALDGILPEDVILVGAPPGAGKTQFCVNLALANVEAEKRVHYFALEAGEFEIQQRIKYQFVASSFFADPKRPKLEAPLSFRNWYLGKCGTALLPYDEVATSYCFTAFKNLSVYYKRGPFTVSTMVEMMNYVHGDTDLIIIDHLHYFDWDGDNDNRAIKEIVQTARTLALELKTPVVLVSHLRKRDRNNKELCPGPEEFHGSSELIKIATKGITIGPGKAIDNLRFNTYFRAIKFRFDGGVNRYIGEAVFNNQKSSYEKEYRIGKADDIEFADLEDGSVPGWAKPTRNMLQHLNPPSGVLTPFKARGGQKPPARVPYGNQGDEV